LVPPGAQVEFRYRGRSEHLYVHFRAAEGPCLLPAVQDAAAEMPALSGMLRTAMDAAARESPHATAEVWAALWRVADLAAAANRPHAAVAAAIAHIEAGLAGALTVPAIARAVGVSHNHLTRLF